MIVRPISRPISRSVNRAIGNSSEGITPGTPIKPVEPEDPVEPIEPEEPAVPFTPLTLFANGEQGAWYDPDALSTLFQGSMGADPVTEAGQVIGLMLDNRLSLVRGEELFDDKGVTFTSAAYSGRVTPGHYRAWRTAGGVGGVILKTGLVAGKWYEIDVTFSPYAGDDPDVASSRVSLGFAFTAFYSPPTGYTEPIRTTLIARATATDLRVIIPAPGFGADISVTSIKELPGNHAAQPTAASRPALRGSPWRLDFDDIDDSTVTAFPSALGSACTVARSIPGIGAQILTGQTIGTSFTDNVDSCAIVIIDRALTAGETENLTTYLSTAAGL